MTVTTVFSSAIALLSSDFISNYSGSDLDALLTKLRRHSGIKIVKSTKSIRIAGKWTSVLEAHAILRDSISKAKSIFDGDRSKLNERNEIIKNISNAKEGYRSTTRSDEISNILELQKPENKQALEEEIERQAPTGYTAEDFRSRNANSTPRSEEYNCILKDINRSIKSVKSETSFEKQKKNIILDHTYFKYSNECEKYTAVNGDVITSYDYNNTGSVLDNLAKENTQSASLGDENGQLLCNQTQTERTATVMGPVGLAIRDPVSTPTQVSASKTSLLSSGSHTKNTNGVDMIIKNQKKSSAMSQSFERPSKTSFEEIQTINYSGTFPSEVCGFVDESESQIKQPRVKQDGVRIKCDDCDKNFGSKSDLKQHRINEHKNGEWKSIPNTSGSLPCFKCDYIGKSRDRIREHWIRAHCRRFKCNDCGKFFGQKTDLKRHRQAVHVPGRVCKYCDKSYKTKTGYNVHLAYQHGDGINHLYTCDTCNKRHTSVKNIASHIEKDHLGIIPVGTFLCHVCGKKYRRKQAYDVHMDVHSDVKLYQCDTCKKRFATKHGYQEHIVIHTDRVKHKCEICGKAYFTKRSLRLHKNVSHGEGQRHSFQCEICDKKYISNYRLRMHQKIHAKSRDHVCNICGKDFTQLTSLQRHQRIHSDDKPYSCSFCRKTSTDVSVIRRHVMLVHKKDPETWQEFVEKSVN